MELIECLSRTATEQLHRIAGSIRLDPTRERGALEREVAASLTDHAQLTSLLADLTEDEWAALKVVFFNGGDQGITVELCHQIVNLLSGKRRKSSARAVEQLQDRGLIYPRTQNYRQVLFIPADLLVVLTEILNRHMIHRICVDPAVPVRSALPERDLVEDIHRFLAYVNRNEITLTQQGQIFKRHLRALYELLLTGEPDDESLVGRYPEPLGMLVGYALDRHLIAREGGQLGPTEELLQWIERPTGAKQSDMFAYWQDRYFYQDLQIFLSVMRTVKEQWVSIGRLVAEAEPLINPSQRGSFLLRLKHHLSTFLAPLGLLETGFTEGPDEPDLLCRLTPAGVAILNGGLPDPPQGIAENHLLLQATFEIIAPRPVPAQTLWVLELMADLTKRADRTLTYRLSRQSVYRALKKGLSGEQMLAFLRQASSTGLPQNVAFDLTTWAASYGQVYLQQVTLLRCASPLLAQQVKVSRRTARFVLGELTPTDLIVDSLQYPDLLEALEADGLMPRPDVDQPTVPRRDEN